MRTIVNAFSFIRFLDAANIITMICIMFSFFAVGMANKGMLSYAAIIICGASAMDFVDGYVARTWLAHRVENRTFGKQLDSLADLLNFSIAPALLLIHLANGPFANFSACLLIFSGAVRLAVFSVVSGATPHSYKGLPTTYAGLIFSLLFQMVATGTLPLPWLPWFTLLIAILQVVNIRIPKYKAIPTIIAFLSGFIVVTLFLNYFR